jgi:aminopeptidase N
MLRCCDAAMFEQLHAVSKAAKDESELRRYYSALMSVQNSGLAQQAARFKLAEIK